MTRNRPVRLATLLLAVCALVASACGQGDAVADGSTSPADDGVFRVALVAPSASIDYAFTQSMVDSIWAIEKDMDLEFKITDGVFIVEEAEAAIRQYASEDFDLVIAHGSQYGESVERIATEFPDVAFAWGTASENFGLSNVSAYTVSADEGGFVMGTIAAQISETKVIGIVGPIEVGDAALYINGFVAGVESQDADVVVNTEYIGSFSDTEMAATVAAQHIEDGADILTGSAQMVTGAIAVADTNDIPWFGTQSNQTLLNPKVVVASQVYHWEVVFEQIIADIQNGTLGGETHLLTLANGGIEIEYNYDFVFDRDVRLAADATIAALTDGSITTGI